jgi:hypothetical protein
MWRGEVKRTWPILHPRNSDALWSHISDAWDEVASSHNFLQLLVESVARQMQSVVEVQGLWASYQGGYFLETAC